MICGAIDKYPLMLVPKVFIRYQNSPIDDRTEAECKLGENEFRIPEGEILGNEEMFRGD